MSNGATVDNPGTGATLRGSQIGDINNDVKMVIWDLDDTLWNGTLAEGGIEFVEKHGELVKTLAGRGILSSIASKNDFNSVKEILEKHDLWDYFVFPSISFEPKGQRVSQIIENAALRRQNVLFIDDNIVNLEEVRFFNNEIMVADPQGLLAVILDHPRLAGKPDPELKRLKQYQLLQRRFIDQKSMSLSNEEFLRSSDIKIYFDFDIEKHFDRIVELINRTNQLNYTKKRLESEDDIRHFRSNFDTYHIFTACISCTDRYGDYGVIGFYMLNRHPTQKKLIHFVFSCRTMNMGIEQFVYEHLEKPPIDIISNVAYGIQCHEKIDWITIADTPNRPKTLLTQNKRLLLVGGCETERLSIYCSSNRVELVNRILTDQGLDYEIRYEDLSFFLADRELLRKSEPIRQLHIWSYEDALLLDKTISEAEIIILGMRGLFGGTYFTSKDDILVRLRERNVENYITARKDWFEGNFSALNISTQDRLRQLTSILERVDRDSLPNSSIFLLGVTTKLEFGMELLKSKLYNDFCERFCRNAEKFHFVDVEKIVPKESVVGAHHLSHAGYHLLATHINQVISSSDIIRGRKPPAPALDA